MCLEINKIKTNLVNFQAHRIQELNSLRILSKKVEEIVPKSRKSNLTTAQQQALQLLQTREGIVIKPADKGSNVVIMTDMNYVKICNKILSIKSWYRKTSMLEISAFQRSFERMINLAFTNQLIRYLKLRGIILR